MRQWVIVGLQLFGFVRFRSVAFGIRLRLAFGCVRRSVALGFGVRLRLAFGCVRVRRSVAFGVRRSAFGDKQSYVNNI